MKKIISNILSIGIVILLVGTIIFVYNKYYFNDFSKAQEYNNCLLYTSMYLRMILIFLVLGKRIVH